MDNNFITFNSIDEITDHVVFSLGYMASILGSKSGYARMNPDHMVIYNANVYVNNIKIWYGDIDITLKINNLMTLSKMLATASYANELKHIIGEDDEVVLRVLYEMDGRFQNEDSPLLKNAAISFDGMNVVLNSNLKSMFALIVDGDSLSITKTIKDNSER